MLRVLRDWQGAYPYAPSVREILERMDGTLSSTSSVAFNLRHLRRLGFIDFLDGENRTVHLAGSRYLLPDEPDILEDWRAP